MRQDPVYIQILLKENCPYCENVKYVIEQQVKKSPQIHNLPLIYITDSNHKGNPYKNKNTVDNDPLTYPLMEIKDTKDSSENLRIVMDSEKIIQYLLSYDLEKMGEIHLPTRVHSWWQR